MGDLEIVSRTSLKLGDVITYINLADATDVKQGVKVTYLWDGVHDLGIRYDDGSQYGYTIPHSTAKNLLLLRQKKEEKPANWPPIAHDVWRFGDGTIYHAFLNHTLDKDGILMWRPGGGTLHDYDTHCEARNLLKKHKTAELLFRLND